MRKIMCNKHWHKCADHLHWTRLRIIVKWCILDWILGTDTRLSGDDSPRIWHLL